MLNLGKAVIRAKLMKLNLAKVLPYRLNISVTNVCNSRCRICSIWQLYKRKSYKRTFELRLDEYEQLFKSLGSSLVWLHLTGGEPTLRSDLPEIVQIASEVCPHIQIIDIPSNGLIPHLAEKFALEILRSGYRGLLSIGVSMDGDPATNDFIRGVNGGWDRALDTYMRLFEISKQYPNFRTGIGYTISSLNAGKLGAMIEAIRERNVPIDPNEISISIAHTGISFYNLHLGSANACRVQNDNAFKDIDFILNNKWQFRHIRAVHHIRPLIKRAFLRYGKYYLRNPKRMILPCAACYASCFIDPYGTVYPCTIWDRALGNLRTNGMNFNKIWFSKSSEQARPLIKEGNCPRCWSGCESSQTLLDNFLKVLPVLMCDIL